MTQYKIDIAPEAAKEIEDIYLYIAKDSQNNATSWYFAIYDKIQTLKDFPARCPMAFEDPRKTWGTATKSILNLQFPVVLPRGIAS